MATGLGDESARFTYSRTRIAEGVAISSMSYCGRLVKLIMPCGPASACTLAASLPRAAHADPTHSGLMPMINSNAARLNAG